MSISLNIHRTVSVEIKEHENGNHKWIDLKLGNKDGLSHDIAIFDVTLLDFQNAIEKELHKKSDIIEASEVGYII